MTSEQKKNLWIILGHPRQIAMALVLSKNFSKEFPCHLVISRNKYWKTIEIDEYRPLFKSITFFEPIYHTHSIKQLFQAVRDVYKTRAAMRKLPVAPQDILVSLEVWNYIENIMTTVWRQNKQILIYPGRISSYISMSRKQIYSQKNYYISKSGYVHFFLDKILGLRKQTFYYWIRGGFPRYDHAITYSKPVEQYYNKTFVLKSIFSENLKESEIYYPFYSLREQASSSGGKMVVFFISGYVTDPEYNRKISSILQNLRRHYWDGYDLQIRLHPNQPDSDKQFDCSGWTINRESGNAQLFLTRHADKIAAAFSDKSTTMSFPINMGITTHSYHRAVGLAEYVEQAIDTTYKDAPREFFMETVDQIPVPYPPVKDAKQRAISALDRIHKELITS